MDGGMIGANACSFLAGAGVSGIFLLGFAWLFRKYLGSYVAKKGENLATKEDITEISKLQSDVKHKFDLLLEAHKTESQLRMAVIEQRFQAHQEAYTLWLNLFRNVHTEKNNENVLACQEWWGRRNLYLEAGPRKAFKAAYLAASNHPNFLKGPRDDDHKKLIRENWDDIVSAGSEIEQAVKLPSLGVSSADAPQAPAPTALGPENKE